MKLIIIISEFKDATLEQGFLSFSKTDNKFKYKFVTIISSEYTFKLDFIKQCKNLFSQKPKAVILCRFINNLSFEIIKNCKVNNIKTIFFIDDYLYSVPEFIKKEKYSSKIFKNQLSQISQQVDYIVTSTPALKQNIENLNYKKRIFALNDIRFHLYHDLRPFKRPHPVIGYMGSKSHKSELDHIMPAINNLLLKNPNICFETFGVKLDFKNIDNTIHKRIKCRNAVSGYKKFINKLNSLGWWVGLAPLFSNEFNRCKTICKWIEYTECNVPMISSKVKPYINLGTKELVENANDNEEWEEKILFLINNKSERNKLIKKSNEYLRENYSSIKAIKRMQKILDNI
ncbi:glycosyltransferase [uncultured Prochlorococcus sp.]|uniref:glycosyltransferase n=1 Tax=uncultured Prochlorococcus sp. TaxID=159733 RepID=UPI0025902A6E|nr:glycosyltransferase [uncultured Prochlorococcus sp.]